MYKLRARSGNPYTFCVRTRARSRAFCAFVKASPSRECANLVSVCGQTPVSVGAAYKQSHKPIIVSAVHRERENKQKNIFCNILLCVLGLWFPITTTTISTLLFVGNASPMCGCDLTNYAGSLNGY